MAVEERFRCSTIESDEYKLKRMAPHTVPQETWMLIGVPLETAAGETRVAVTPETVKKLKVLPPTEN